MSILFFDPGGTTGWAHIEPTKEPTKDDGRIHVGTFDAKSMTDEEIHDHIWAVLQAGRGLVVVGYEEFTPHFGIDRTAERVIEQLKIVCAKEGIERVVSQRPSDRANSLETAKMLLHRKSVHECDALAHAIAYARRNS